MSNSEVYEKVTTESGGVTVTKRFEEDEFPVPAIAFEFASDRDEEVTVRLADRVPDEVAVEDLGFHPEYGSEHWTIDEETITFERDLEANAEYTTVYGIRATGTENVEQFLTDPVIENVDPPLPDGERAGDGSSGVVPGSGEEAVRDAIGGEGEGHGREDDGSDDEEIEPLDLTDPNAPDGETSGGGATEASSADVDLDEGSLVSAMADEIRTNDVDVGDLRLLQRAFDQLAGESGDGSTEARIGKLQSDIADLRAYTDALEEFLGENGTGEQLIGDFERRLEEFDDALQSVESDVDERVDDLRATVQDVDDTVEDLQSSLDDLEDRVADDEAIERIADVESEVEDLQRWQEQIKKTFGG